MAERPILCAGSVVRNILSGRQTQDRRPVRGYVSRRDYLVCEADHRGVVASATLLDGSKFGAFVAPWSPGDVLYVRETWAPANLSGAIAYRADGEIDGARWRPSIHMPKWAARLHITVLAVTVERVSAISEEDAMSEGIQCVGGRYTNGSLTEYREPIPAFAALWDSLYGAGSFDRGDWCWVTRFEVRK